MWGKKLGSRTRHKNSLGLQIPSSPWTEPWLWCLTPLLLLLTTGICLQTLTLGVAQAVPIALSQAVASIVTTLLLLRAAKKNVAAAQWREQRRLLCSALLWSRRGESSSWCSCLGVKVRLLGVPSDLLSWAAASVDATTGILASSPRTRPWPPVLVMGPWTTTSRLSLPAPWPWVRPSGMETFISFLGRADFCTVSPATALGKGKALAINILGVDDCSVILASSPSTGEATGLLHATH